MFDGLYQSAVVYFVPYITWETSTAASWDGRAMDSVLEYGTTVAVSAMLAANFYVAMNTK
jgi:phospholipid-translocating ATPase